MLEVKVFKNNPDNDWLIHQSEAYNFGGHSVSDKFLPRPYISLIFHFKDRPFIHQDPPLELEPFFVAPIIPNAIILKFHGIMDTLTIHCKATVFSRIFRLDMSPVSKRSINLPRQVFQPLWNAMKKLDSTKERIQYFTDFVNSAQETTFEPDAVDILYDKIIEKSIATSVSQIIGECYASKSTLLRKFEKRTGVSPKVLARIVRLDYLWKKIRDENATDYQELIFHGNYFDQSHFINDFKSIIGETPGYFFNRNLQIVRMFSGQPEENN